MPSFKQPARDPASPPVKQWEGAWEGQRHPHGPGASLPGRPRPKGSPKRLATWLPKSLPKCCPTLSRSLAQRAVQSIRAAFIWILGSFGAAFGQLCFWAAFGQLWGSFWAAFGPTGWLCFWAAIWAHVWFAGLSTFTCSCQAPPADALPCTPQPPPPYPPSSRHAFRRRADTHPRAEPRPGLSTISVIVQLSSCHRCIFSVSGVAHLSFSDRPSCEN